MALPIVSLILLLSPYVYCQTILFVLSPPDDNCNGRCATNEHCLRPVGYYGPRFCGVKWADWNNMTGYVEGLLGQKCPPCQPIPYSCPIIPTTTTTVPGTLSTITAYDTLYNLTPNPISDVSPTLASETCFGYWIVCALLAVVILFQVTIMVGMVCSRKMQSNSYTLPVPIPTACATHAAQPPTGPPPPSVPGAITSSGFVDVPLDTIPSVSQFSGPVVATSTGNPGSVWNTITKPIRRIKKLPHKLDWTEDVFPQTSSITHITSV